MKKRIIILLPLCILITGVILALSVYQMPFSYNNDVITLNRLAKETAAHWGDLESADYGTFPYPVTVISKDGELLFHSKDNAMTINEALYQGNPILDVTEHDELLGKIIISHSPNDELLQFRRTAVFFILAITVLLILSLCLYLYYLEAKIIRPFRELEIFASEISNGNLSFPLKMKKNNLFGAFTESFDMMREQLMLAKEKEFQANMNQKELVASLSHDIKTPVTSIRLTIELLLALESKETQDAPASRHNCHDLKKKLKMIYQKAEQIDELVTNLFQSTLQDMEQLTVTALEQYSTVLEDLIRNVDYKGKVIISPIPECILWMDELRMSQILSNILSNSYKYADTDILVNASVRDNYLSLSIHDFGASMMEEELPYLFNKFYRGGNAASANGSGLGLYICKKLIEQMQGKIYCTCSNDGFFVVLMLKLV